MTEHLGDNGTTLNYKGERIPKDHLTIVVSGKIDALLSALDIVLLSVEEPKFQEWIHRIERKLWQTAGEISLGGIGKNVLECISASDIVELEQHMSQLRALPTQFVRFSQPASVFLNEARVRCRELEVGLTPFLREKKLRPEVYKYVNRLSLFLFHLAYHLDNA